MASRDLYYATNAKNIRSMQTTSPVSPEKVEIISPESVRMKIIWTGPGYYIKYNWKGEALLHRSSKKEGVLYREKPYSRDGVLVIDVDRYDEKYKLESLLKNQLLNDFRSIGVKVTEKMEDWANHGTKYHWQFIPGLLDEYVIWLNRSEWRGCVWNCPHYTTVTIHPRLQDILYSA